jgi:hypothetical protein
LTGVILSDADPYFDLLGCLREARYSRQWLACGEASGFSMGRHTFGRLRLRRKVLVHRGEAFIKLWATSSAYLSRRRQVEETIKGDKL